MVNNQPPFRPPITSNFPLELNEFDSIEGKILSIIRHYNECPKKWLLPLLKDYNINPTQISTALKGLKKKSFIHNVSHGVWKFGKRITIIRATHSKGSTGNVLEGYENQEEFKLLNGMPYIHNVQGIIEVKYWGKLEPSKKIRDKLQKDLGDGAYILLQRQGFTLEFYLANKRPAFDLGHLLKCFRALDDYLWDLEIKGKVIITSFEMREQQYGVIADLRHNPIEHIVLENYIIRIYQEDGIINKEIRPFGLNLSRSEVIEWIVNLDTSLKPVQIIEKVTETANLMHISMDTANREFIRNQKEIKQTQKEFKQIQQNGHSELMDLRISSAQATEQMDDVNLLADKMNNTLQVIQTRVDGMQTTMGEIDENIGKSTYDRDTQTRILESHADIMDNQTEILDRLSDTVVSIKSDLQKEKEKDQLWREMDTIARLETIKEYRELNQSWSQIAEIFETHKKGIWLLLKNLDPDYFEKDRLKKEKSNQLRKRKLDVGSPPIAETISRTTLFDRFQEKITKTSNLRILKEIVGIIKQNSGISRSQIREQLSTKYNKQKFLWIIRYLIESNKVITIPDQKHRQKQILYYNFKRW